MRKVYVASSLRYNGNYSCRNLNNGTTSKQYKYLDMIELMSFYKYPQ